MAREENSSDNDSSRSEKDKEERLATECNDDDTLGSVANSMDINMVFTIPTEFRAPENDVADLALGAERAVFERLKNVGEHMKPSFIKGHLDGKPLGRMMVDGGVSVNIMPLSVFEKLGHDDGNLKQRNLSLCGFSGELVMAHGIVPKELIVGSKTMPTTFFMVDAKGWYNVLFGCDCIHANECVPSTLHQCVIQWIGNRVDLLGVDEMACIAVTESQVDILGGQMRCLTGRDLAEYDYVSVSKEGFVPISIKPMVSTTWLSSDIV
jgi:hypothetical protein